MVLAENFPLSFSEMFPPMAPSRLLVLTSAPSGLAFIFAGDFDCATSRVPSGLLASLEKGAQKRKIYRLWGSNPRKVSLADLKSAPFDHSGKSVFGK